LKEKVFALVFWISPYPRMKIRGPIEGTHEPIDAVCQLLYPRMKIRGPIEGGNVVGVARDCVCIRG